MHRNGNRVVMSPGIGWVKQILSVMDGRYQQNDVREGLGVIRQSHMYFSRKNTLIINSPHSSAKRKYHTVEASSIKSSSHPSSQFRRDSNQDDIL